MSKHKKLYWLLPTESLLVMLPWLVLLLIEATGLALPDNVVFLAAVTTTLLTLSILDSGVLSEK